MSQSPLDKLARHERNRREILQRCDRLPPLPDVVVRVLELIDAPDTEPETLADELQRDPVLVARMLGAVNSPLYGLRRTISSIVEAVVVLGFRGLRSLVLASGAAKIMQSDFSAYGHDAGGLWRHSLAVATTCREIAKHGGDPTLREELFVAGLLHDIGKLVLAPYLDEQGSTLVGEPQSGWIAAEREALGIDHAEVGALIAERWNLDERVRQLLAHHHAAEPPQDLRSPVAILQLADRVVHGLGVGDRGASARDDAAEAPLIAEAGLSAAAWSQLQPHLAELARTASSQLADAGATPSA